MTPRPQARETTRQLYGKHPWLKDAKGRPVKFTRGRETIRTATCSAHKKTGAFDGVTDAGWIFICPGNGDGESRHSFAAEPPA